MEERRPIKQDVTAWDLCQKQNKPEYQPIITFSEAVDVLLKGGIPIGMVTEIFGGKGVGKTTFCYQLCIDVQLSKDIDVGIGALESQAIFIDTEQSFVTNRVKTMAEECVTYCKSITPTCSMNVNSIMNGIHVLRCSEAKYLLKILKSVPSYLRTNPKIKLIVVDSLAFLFYSEDHDFQNRTKMLYSLAKEFNQLAYKFGIAIVVTNSMTTRFNEEGQEYFIPFLGETWGYVPNLRVQLCCNSTSRVAKVIKSSICKTGSAPFRITHQGIRD